MLICSSYTNAVQPDDPQLWVMLDSVKVCASFISIGRASLVIILRDVARFTPLLARLVQ